MKTKMRKLCAACLLAFLLAANAGAQTTNDKGSKPGTATGPAPGAPAGNANGGNDKPKKGPGSTFSTTDRSSSQKEIADANKPPGQRRPGTERPRRPRRGRV